MSEFYYSTRRRLGRIRAEMSRRRRSAAAQLQISRGHTGQRLVASPVFVLSCERSGSTLLRAILDSHTEICAPHELHMRLIEVSMRPKPRRAMKELGLTERDLENMLWDHVLHTQLVASGKSVVVDKTPHNMRAWGRINGWWPEARYIFLYRHPQRILDSLMAARPDISRAEHRNRVIHNETALSRANRSLDGLRVQYEELTHEPARVTAEICAYLGVPWEQAMIDYRATPRSYRRGLGDWSETLASGRIVPERPLPAIDDVDADLQALCRLAGYGG